MTRTTFVSMMALVASILAPATAPAVASTPLFELAAGVSTGGTVSSELGFSFAVDESFQVVALGFFDAAGDGLVGDHTVTLWSLAGASLASAVIPAGTAAGLVDGYRYVAISPLTLSGGSTYVLSAHFPQVQLTDDIPFEQVPADSIFDPRVTPIEGRFIFPVLVPTFPSNDSTFLRLAPNLQIASAVSEPATLLLLGCGLVAVSIARRRG